MPHVPPLGGEVEVTTPTIGLCTACGSLEVALNNVIGHLDFVAIGERGDYPTGYGCEVCS